MHEGVEGLLRDKSNPPGKTPVPPKRVAEIVRPHAGNAAARSDPLGGGAGDERMSSSPRCAVKRTGRFLSVATKNSDACDQPVGQLYRRQWTGIPSRATLAK